MSALAPSRQAIEDFLFHESALLDEWRLTEWLALFHPDATYHVPALDTPDAEPQDSLSLVADDMVRLGSRVNQLTGRTMWAETPLSRTRRLISNVRVLGLVGAHVRVAANFAIYRMRHQAVDVYVGRYDHLLAMREDGLQFLRRKAVLDLESLKPHGKVSIIL